MLKSSREQYQEQQKINASALIAARRKRRSGARAVATVISTHQAEAAALSLNSLPDQLDEQGIEAPAVATARIAPLVSGPGAADLVDATKTKTQFDRLVLSLVMNASRTASVVDLGRRPALTGYVRVLVAPSCARCAILAGRYYRHSQGFQRHPRCDCTMQLSTAEVAPNLVIDPESAVRAGQVRGLSKADMKAFDEGADLNQIVNVRSKKAGLTVGSSVISRGSRLTPEGIQRIASDRDQFAALLRSNGYLL